MNLTIDNRTCYSVLCVSIRDNLCLEISGLKKKGHELLSISVSIGTCVGVDIGIGAGVGVGVEV